MLARSVEHSDVTVHNNKTIVFSIFLLLIVTYIVSFLLIEILKLVKDVDASTSEKECIHYLQLQKIILIDCKSTNLTDVYTRLNNSVLLHREKTGIWILNANIMVEGGAKFYVNSSDTSWLKINSTDGSAYYIGVRGSMQIDSTKITGWDTQRNTFAETDAHGHYPRSFIKVLEGSNPQARTDITNSEIAYLGYNQSRSFGLSYYSGTDSIIKGNKIHNLWHGFYSANYGYRVFYMTIENNHFYNNSLYGIDPHSGTHDIVIRNNTVFDNGKHGIICSQLCHDIVIENNRVYNNADTGIMLDKNVTRSIIRNNIMNDNVAQIAIHNFSNFNQIYGNRMNGGEIGIEISDGSANNIVSDNEITGAVYGIHMPDAGHFNRLVSNDITNSSIPIY
jgi:parallel beta-helix repeat protein